MNNPTPVYEDNEACIKVINARHPTDRTRHIDTPAFRVQSWRERGDLIFRHIKGILNPALGWVLHTRHSRRLMGHYKYCTTSTSTVKHENASCVLLSSQ